MGSTFQSILDSFIDARDAQYRDDNQMMEARLENLESTIQAMLEKLRDKFDPR